MDSFDGTYEENEVITIISEDAEDAEDETSNNEDSVTVQLVNTGPEGASTSGAVVSSRRRRYQPYGFEPDPTLRMGHYNRLMRIMLQAMNELSTRVDKQVALVVAGVDGPNSCQVFGSKSLRHVIRKNGSLILDNLMKVIAARNLAADGQPSNAIKLPPLVFGGLPTPVNRMSQTQLRSFIPMMLKYSLGRSKPGWGVEASKPSWWPQDVPWSNIRTDPRSEEDKKKVSWTRALKQVVVNCYNYHRRQDLLPIFSEEDLTFNSTVSFGSTSENDESEKVEAIEVEAEQDSGNANGTECDTNNVFYCDNFVISGIRTVDTSDGTDMEQDQDVVQSEDLADGNQIEYYLDDAEQDDAEQDNAEQDDAEQDDAEQDDAEQDSAEQDDAEQDDAEQDDAEQDSAEQDDAEQDNAELADENHMEEDVDDGKQSEYLAGENRMDYYVNDGDREEEDIDNMVPYDELTDVEEMEYYVRNAALSPTQEFTAEAVGTELTRIEFIVEGTIQFNEAVATPNYPEQPMNTAFQSGEDPAGSSQSQSQVCDSTQSEETIQKVGTIQSGESGSFPIYRDSLLNDFEVDSDETVYLDPTGHHLVDELPEIEGNGHFEPEGRLFLRPITAEDEDGGDFSYILDLREGAEYSSEDNSREE